MNKYVVIKGVVKTVTDEDTRNPFAVREIKSVIEDGKEIYLIPVGKDGGKGYAAIEKKDFDLLVSLGLSGAWDHKHNSVIVPGCLSVARILLDAKPGQVVRFRDRDPFNLRSDNLYLEAGRSTRWDRRLLTPKDRAYRRNIRLQRPISPASPAPK